jgi:hypothetical protein
MKNILLLLLTVTAAAFGQVTVDNSGAAQVVPWPLVVQFPGVCKYGQVIQRSDLPIGSNIYQCGTHNDWNQVASSTSTGAAITSNDGSVTVVGSDLSVNPALFASAAGNTDLSGANKVGLGGNGFVSVSIPNEGTTGTTLNLLAILTAATAKVPLTSTTSGIVGVVISGAGTAGNARIATQGWANCIFDGATTANHYIGISASSAGKCTDVGAALPSTGQVLGIVTTTNGGGGTYAVLLQPPTIGISRVKSFGYSFDGGGSALSSGVTKYITVPFACAITAWDILVDTGTGTIDVWKIATGTVIPTISNTITASAKPVISSGTALRSTTLTGWTTAVAANDIIGINLNAVASATYLNFSLECLQ